MDPVSSTGMTPRKVYLYARPPQRITPGSTFAVKEMETLRTLMWLRGKGCGAANVPGPGGVPVQGTERAADRDHYRAYARRRGPPRNSQQNYQKSESGEKNEGSESAPEGRAQQRRPYRGRRFPPSYMRRPYGRRPPDSNPPVQGDVMGGADHQGAGEQDHDSAGLLLAKDSLEGWQGEVKENQGDETQGRQPSQRRYVATSITDADAQKTLNHKMAKRQKPPGHQLRI
ncbi:hypothetical protein GH733_016446, partial [Mirounga leonina]